MQITAQNSEIVPFLHVVETFSGYDFSKDITDFAGLTFVGNLTITKVVPATATEPEFTTTIEINLS
jgi:hypothetical protein